MQLVSLLDASEKGLGMFQAIDLSFLSVHEKYWAATPVKLPDYTFVNLYAWAEGHRLVWEEEGELLWLKKEELTDTFWAPLGNWQTADWKRILERFASGTVFERVPAALIEKLTREFPGRFAVEETPEEWDYLYEQKALATLSGAKLHKKKNHWNAFIKTYGEDFRKLSVDDAPAVAAFEEAWYEERPDRDTPAIANENRAVLKILENAEIMRRLSLGALYYEEKMIAFALGEALDEKTFLVHFEKGLPAYRGVYQAINLAFAREFGAGFEFINREQDSGSDGLRHAKRSYFPIAYGIKNRLRLI